MSTTTALYKCRLCNTVFKTGLGGAVDRILDEILIHRRLDFPDLPNVAGLTMYSPYDRHECNEHEVGLAEFVGYCDSIASPRFD